ncbi:TrmH family RNA methyltransferase [Propionibacteriaceae bacterium Y2011]|uniref:TrmH family RNA methyltransferase n=1 Tax=Microlunatus sp. Y2014 TaxID=3418488 RepID=UPI003B478108
MSTVEPTGLPIASAGQLRSARRLSSHKQRTRTGTFLAEGPQAVAEALDHADLVLITPQAADRHRDLVAAVLDRGIDVATTATLTGIADAVTPQGIVAVCRTLHVDLATALAGGPRLVVVLAQVRDPGNAGTVIRCADAFGADAVVLTRDSVDPYNPKCVRASVGSLFHLPLVIDVELADALAACRAAGTQVLATAGSGDADLDDLNRNGGLTRPTTWLFGNEAWGLPESDAALADRVVGIPMWGRAESLNLATAAAVCLYTTAAAQR